MKNLKSQPPRTLRRMGRGTNRRVTTGTGEALPDPVTCDVVTGESSPITGLRREVGVVSGGRGEAAVVLLEPSGQHNRR